MITKTVINTIRHAKTNYNLENRYAGSTDVSLSKEGIQDTREMAEMLVGKEFDPIITSTLKRSIDTAQILFNTNERFEKNELCNERNFGILEGLTWKEAQVLKPPVTFLEIGDDLHSINPDGGEPLEEVWLRAKKFYDFLFANHKGSNILIVSHSIFLQVFHGILRGINLIESLAEEYPATLDLTTFHFLDNELISEKQIKFSSPVENNF